MTNINIKISDELHTALKHSAIDKGIPLKEFVREAIKEKIDKERK